jgi:hypothetical protein
LLIPQYKQAKAFSDLKGVEIQLKVLNLGTDQFHSNLNELSEQIVIIANSNDNHILIMPRQSGIEAEANLARTLKLIMNQKMLLKKA